MPLFVCDRRLRVYQRLPVAAAPWALDSGGFTELQQLRPVDRRPGRVRRRGYAATATRSARLTWAAPQDWMCEPIVISGGQAGRLRFAGTGLTVAEHQRRTVANLAQLRALAPDLPWLPVLQGYTTAEYLACADMYAAAGIDLTAEPLVGLGSVCRRQATGEAHQIITALHRRGITRLHGFGVKILGLRAVRPPADLRRTRWPGPRTPAAAPARCPAARPTGRLPAPVPRPPRQLRQLPAVRAALAHRQGPRSCEHPAPRRSRRMIPGQDDDAEDRLARGEAVPGGPGACDRDGCAHLTLWHGEHGRYRGPALPPVRLPGLPCPSPAGAAILGQLHAVLTRYVILPSAEAAVAVALWIAATHAQPAWAHAPRLVIRAPVKRCGKSRLLDIVEGTCHAPLITVNASPAAVYRAIGTDTPPTLLVDEADTIFGGKNADANEDLRGLLNAGHQRNRPAIRWDAGTRSLETIPTFAMAALAGIGAMPDTIEDRAVVIQMRRRGPGEIGRAVPAPPRPARPHLRRRRSWPGGWASTWPSSSAPSRPCRWKTAPPTPGNRWSRWPTWRAARWPDLARDAAVALTADQDSEARTSDGIRLLADIRAAFAALGNPEAATTKDLLRALNADPEAPWAAIGPTGLTGKRLGDMLARLRHPLRHDPVPRSARPRATTAPDFTDAWRRYCPPAGRGTRTIRTNLIFPGHPWYGFSAGTD